MKTALKKISDCRGAGILYALLVLLVVGTVSAVIITAALSNTGRIENRVEEEQLYLAAESAAEILSNDWDFNLGCAFVQLSDSWQDYWSAEGKKTLTIPSSDYFYSLAKAIYNGDTPPESRVIRFTFENSVENFDNILVTAKLSAPNYASAVATEYLPISGESNSEELIHFMEKFNVLCDISARYVNDDGIPPYIIRICLTPAKNGMMYDNKIAYANWEVNSIQQGEQS